MASRLLGLGVRIPPKYECLSVVSVVFCHVGLTASSRLFFQRSPTECGVSEFYHEALMMRFWPTGGGGGCCITKGGGEKLEGTK
jgi:hypothetical protein